MVQYRHFLHLCVRWRIIARRELGALRFGSHSITWDGRDEKGDLLAPQIYIVGMVAGTPWTDFKTDWGRLLICGNGGQPSILV